jgi:iron complex transport system substrate-binding protein
VYALPSIGGYTARTISVEAILALEPDLVVAGTRSQKDAVTALEQAGITVYTLAPATLDDIESGLLTLGDLTDNHAGAAAVVADMQMRTQAVTDKVATIPAADRLRVYYEVADEPYTTATQRTVIGELLALAGSNNIFAGLDDTYPEVSAEQIATLDPQVILGPSSRAEQLTPDAVAARPGWNAITAAQTGAVYVVDSDLIGRPGPRIVDALEALAALLYPEYFRSAVAAPLAVGL